VNGNSRRNHNCDKEWWQKENYEGATVERREQGTKEGSGGKGKGE